MVSLGLTQLESRYKQEALQWCCKGPGVARRLHADEPALQVCQRKVQPAETPALLRPELTTISIQVSIEKVWTENKLQQKIFAFAKRWRTEDLMVFISALLLLESLPLQKVS